MYLIVKYKSTVALILRYYWVRFYYFPFLFFGSLFPLLFPSLHSFPLDYIPHQPLKNRFKPSTSFYFTFLPFIFLLFPSFPFTLFRFPFPLYRFPFPFLCSSSIFPIVFFTNRDLLLSLPKFNFLFLFTSPSFSYPFYFPHLILFPIN